MNRLVAIAMAGCSLAGVGRAQIDNLDSLLQAHYEAIGGTERVKSVETAQFVGVMSIGSELEAPFVLTFKRPLRSRLEFTVEGRSAIQVYDGKSAWTVLPFAGDGAAESVPEDQARSMSEQADFDGPLIDWRDKGHRLALVGTEELESGPAYKIEAVLSTGSIRNFYIDQESLLTVQQVGTIRLQGQDVEVQTLLRDYRDVDGLLLPYLIESRATGGSQSQRFTIDRIQLNLEVADSLFEMPSR